MAAATVSNRVEGVESDGNRSVTITLGAAATNDTLDVDDVLGSIKDVKQVWKLVTADWVQNTGTKVVTFGAAQGAGTYKVEGK